ncbi:MFS transporter [Bacillus sp. EB600]|uniref:MFS transporter n=1 Tax=Bacillus sp. EB600 TaxID=2806345 RepID=UPI002109205C|nr:MFS transporter [Bacillus sp. EB600]MCQ6280762.1 MFS transporter [Bacillus sp. EB600]
MGGKIQTKPLKLWSKDFILLTSSNMLLYLALQMIVPALPVYVVGTLHGTSFTAGIVISVFALAAVVTRTFIGKILDTASRKKIFYIGLCIYLLSIIGFYWGSIVAILVMLRIMMGIGFGFTSTTTATMVSDIIPLNRMGEGMGYFGLSAGIALGLGPALGLPLLNNYSFNILVSSIVFLVCMVFVLTVFIHFVPNQQTPTQASTIEFHKVIMDRGIMLPCILNTLLSLTYGGIISFIAVFGKELHIMNPGYFFLCNALAIILVRPIAGKLFDKKGPAAVLIPGTILTILALVLLSFTTTPFVFLLSGIVYGLGFGILQPSLQAWTIKRVTPEKRGIANAMFFNSIDFGIAVGSMLLGFVADVTSNSEMYRISALFMVLFLILYGIALIKGKIQSSKRDYQGNVDVQ